MLNLLSRPGNVSANIEFEASDAITTAYQNGFFIPQGYNETEICRLRYFAARFGQRALTLTLIPTFTCNFACPYCYQEEKTPLYMSTQVTGAIIEFVRRKIEEGVINLHIIWYGGEPLLALKTIREISTQILEFKNQSLLRSYHASLVTNGYLLTPDRAAELKALGVNFVQIAIDGPPEVHNRRRKLQNNEGTFV